MVEAHSPAVEDFMPLDDVLLVSVLIVELSACDVVGCAGCCRVANK
jgi:hypothetical protein